MTRSPPSLGEQWWRAYFMDDDRTDVLCSYKQLSPGHYTNERVTDPHAQSHRISFVVLTEVTEEDYAVNLERYGRHHDTPFFQPVWFYRVVFD